MILTSLAGTLEQLIASRVGVVEAAQQISNVRHRLRQDNNPLFLAFLAIDSETDRFPVGPAREHWAPGALPLRPRARDSGAALEAFCC